MSFIHSIRQWIWDTLIWPWFQYPYWLWEAFGFQVWLALQAVYLSFRLVWSFSLLFAYIVWDISTRLVAWFWFILMYIPNLLLWLLSIVLEFVLWIYGYIVSVVLRPLDGICVSIWSVLDEFADRVLEVLVLPTWDASVLEVPAAAPIIFFNAWYGSLESFMEPGL